MDATLFGWIAAAATSGASDVHLAPGMPPTIRRHGALQPLVEAPVSGEMIERLCLAPLPETAREQYHRSGDTEAAWQLEDGTRIRASLLRRRGVVAAVLRLIPSRPPSLSELGLPPPLAEASHLRHGLVLVTGATGSGKSTTLAALVDHILASRPVHVVTIEDPIEFVHRNQRGIVTQRQLGSDTSSFASALRHVLRHDPDVILVGEMRDQETIEAALTLAETGHLVLSTLHSNTAIETIDRLIDAFAAERQTQVRNQIATVLRLVVAQRLLPRRDGTGRVVACEVLLPTIAVRRLIRDGKTHHIGNHLQAGGRPAGLCRMAESIAELVRRGIVAVDSAGRTAESDDDFTIDASPRDGRGTPWRP